jgi:hypothetical protein
MNAVFDQHTGFGCITYSSHDGNGHMTVNPSKNKNLGINGQKNPLYF